MRMLSIILFIGCLMATSFSQAIIVEIGLYQKQVGKKTINLFLFVNDAPSPLDTEANTAQQRQDFIKFLQTHHPEVLIEDNGSYAFDNPEALAYTKAVFKQYHAIDFSVGLVQSLTKYGINATNLEDRHLLFAAMSGSKADLTTAIINDVQKKRDQLRKYSIPKTWSPLPSYIKNIMRKMSWDETKQIVQKSSSPMDFNHPYWLGAYTQLMECSILANIFLKSQSAPSICLVANKDIAENLHKILIKIGFTKEDGEYAPGATTTTTIKDSDEEDQEGPDTEVTLKTIGSFTITAPLNIKQALTSLFSRSIGQQIALSSTTTSSSSTTMSPSLALTQEEPKRKHDSLSIQLPKRPSSPDDITQASPPTSPLSKKNLLLKSSSSSSTSSTSPLSSGKKIQWIDIEQDYPVARIKVLSPEENRERLDYDTALTNEIADDVNKKINDELTHEAPDIETIGSLLSNLAWALTPDNFYKALEKYLKEMQSLYSPEDMSSIASNFIKALKKRSNHKIIELLQSYIIEPTAAPDVSQTEANQLEVWYKKIDAVVLQDNQEVFNVILEAAQQEGPMIAIDVAYHALAVMRDFKMGLKIAKTKILLTDIFIHQCPTDNPDAMATAKVWENMLAEFV